MARHDPQDPNGSTRLGGDSRPTGTNTGADVTGRMAGTPTERPHDPEHARVTDTHRDRTSRLDRDGDGRLDKDDLRGRDRDHGRDYDRDHDGDRDRGHDRDRDFDRDRDRDRHVDRTSAYPADRSHDVRTKPAKTSAAATFALVFGLAALFCALTGILSPAAVLFGLIGLVLAFVGFKMTKRLGVTGKGLAVGGLVTSLLGLLIGAAVIAGAAVFVNDESNLDRIQGWVDDARDNLPSGSEVTDTIEEGTS